MVEKTLFSFQIEFKSRKAVRDSLLKASSILLLAKTCNQFQAHLRKIAFRFSDTIKKMSSQMKKLNKQWEIESFSLIEANLKKSAANQQQKFAESILAVPISLRKAILKHITKKLLIEYTITQYKELQMKKRQKGPGTFQKQSDTLQETAPDLSSSEAFFYTTIDSVSPENNGKLKNSREKDHSQAKTEEKEPKERFNPEFFKAIQGKEENSLLELIEKVESDMHKKIKGKAPKDFGMTVMKIYKGRTDEVGETGFLFEISKGMVACLILQTVDFLKKGKLKNFINPMEYPETS